MIMGFVSHVGGVIMCHGKECKNQTLCVPNPPETYGLFSSRRGMKTDVISSNIEELDVTAPVISPRGHVRCGKRFELTLLRYD
ncbi:hypothetical protein RB195_005805 [Necator americanus]